MRLEDPCDTKKLVASPGVACYDDWEIFTSANRAIPYRQIMVGPTGLVSANTNGELNWRMGVPWDDHGAHVAGDTTNPNLWTEWVAIPLANVDQGGAKPGGQFYLSVIRVEGPDTSNNGVVVDCSLTFANVHEPDRASQFTLAP
jgi:hypothetical protein